MRVFVNRRGQVVVVDLFNRSRAALDFPEVQQEMRRRNVRFLPAQVIRRIAASNEMVTKAAAGSDPDAVGAVMSLRRQGATFAHAIVQIARTQ